MLGLATVGFAVNFWAWALLSPLGPLFKDSLALSAFQQALLVAVPVVFSMPLGYLTRPYIVYRSRDTQLGARQPRRGWERVR